MPDMQASRPFDRPKGRNHIVLARFKLPAAKREGQLRRLKQMLAELEGGSASADPIECAIQLAVADDYSHRPGPEARAIFRKLLRRKEVLERCGGTFSQAQVASFLGLHRRTVGGW